MLSLILAAAAAFHLVTERDPVTDIRSVKAVAGGEEASLSIGCDNVVSNHVQVTVETSRSLLPGNIGTGDKLVISRFNDNAAKNLVWKQDNHSAWLEDRYRIVPYVNKILAAHQLIVRLTAYDGSGLDLTIPLINKDIIFSAIKQCGDVKTLEKLEKNGE